MIGVCGACILLLIEQDLITLVSEQVAHIYIYIYITMRSLVFTRILVSGFTAGRCLVSMPQWMLDFLLPLVSCGFEGIN